MSARLRRRPTVLWGAWAVLVVGVLLALLWWLVPVSSSRGLECGSVREPVKLVEGTGTFTVRPCDGPISDQARLVYLCMTTAIVAVLVLVAGALVPERPSRSTPENWSGRTDEDILRA